MLTVTSAVSMVQPAIDDCRQIIAVNIRPLYVARLADAHLSTAAETCLCVFGCRDC